MKQTAVEWLVKQLNDKVDFIPLNKWDEIRDLVAQAKEMEKEQMVDFAFKYGDLTTREIADSFDKEYKTNEK
jgi:hypothetical protein